MTGFQKRYTNLQRHRPQSSSDTSRFGMHFGFLLSVAIVVSYFLQPIQVAKADWFAPKLEATARENHVEVVVRVSATVGSAVLKNHPLGTYQIPMASKMTATLQAGIAKFDVTIFAEDDIVLVIVDMITPNDPPQKKYSIAYLNR